MIQFNGIVIPGTHGPVLTDPPQLNVARTKFFGVRGESEIRGLIGGRNVFTHIWLHNRYTTEQIMVAQLEGLDNRVETHGDLVITGTVPRTFKHCTFLGFRPDPLGILPDVAGTLDGGWFCPGTLNWYQLTSAI